jgi:hypothetical protein
MLYNTQNYWVFGLCPSSGILEPREHVSENGCFHPQVGGGGKIPTVLGPLERANLNHWTARPDTDPVSETLCFIVSTIPDDRQSPKT